MISRWPCETLRSVPRYMIPLPCAPSPLRSRDRRRILSARLRDIYISIASNTSYARKLNDSSVRLLHIVGQHSLEHADPLVLPLSHSWWAATCSAIVTASMKHDAAAECLEQHQCGHFLAECLVVEGGAMLFWLVFLNVQQSRFITAAGASTKSSVMSPL